jgi:flagellar motility protein MotE (MotC chaperone)
MAKSPGLPGQIGFMALAFLGLNLLGLLVLFGMLALSGRMTSETIGAMAELIRGDAVAITRAEQTRFQELKEMAEEREREERLEKGDGAVLAEAKEQDVLQIEALQRERERIQERLAAERKTVENLRQQIARIKDEAAGERKLLAEEREKRTAVRQAERTQRLMSTFKNMDAGDIATDLSAIADAEPGYAVRLLELMPPDQVAEVLTEMPAQTRQILLPLLHNEYAGMDPEAVVNEWRRRDLIPRQMEHHLRAMGTDDALKVMRLLDRNTRENVWERIAPRRTGGRP